MNAAWPTRGAQPAGAMTCARMPRAVAVAGGALMVAGEPRLAALEPAGLQGVGLRVGVAPAVAAVTCAPVARGAALAERVDNHCCPAPGSHSRARRTSSPPAGPARST